MISDASLTTLIGFDDTDVSANETRRHSSSNGLVLLEPVFVKLLMMGTATEDLGLKGPYIPVKLSGCDLSESRLGPMVMAAAHHSE